MAHGLQIEGWYKDPYGRHNDRWFSDGSPTNLVRDGVTASHDEPPAESFQGELVEADEQPVPDETIRAGDEPSPEVPNGLSLAQGTKPMAWGARSRKVPPPPVDW